MFIFIFSQIIDQLDVYQDGTEYSIYNAMDAQLIVNRTKSTANITSEWDYEAHQRRK